MGNYDDTDSLEKAMNGVHTVLLISSGDQGERMQEHKTWWMLPKKWGYAKMIKAKGIMAANHEGEDKLALVSPTDIAVAVA